jgi:hypothetical protein
VRPNIIYGHLCMALSGLTSPKILHMRVVIISRQNKMTLKGHP